MHVTRIDASMSLGSRHVACHQINQSKLSATTYINPSCHACHSDRYMHATRIDASMSLGSRRGACNPINPSCHACRSDRYMHDVTRIDASMSLGSRLVACHQINQSKLPATKSIQVAMHVTRIDTCMSLIHVTWIDASMSLGSRHIACHQINQSKLPATTYIHQSKLPCMSLGSIHTCHSDRGM
jgi:hypothetical protein